MHILNHVLLGVRILRVHIILLGLIGAFILSGCETMKGSMRDMTSWSSSMKSTSSSQGDMSQSADVQMRADTGAGVTPMPAMGYEPMPTGYTGYSQQNAPTVMGNSHVAVFDDGGYDQYTRGASAAPMGVMPSYSGGVVSGFDSSVEIYSVDGVPMTAGAGQMPEQQRQWSPDGYASGYIGPSGNQIFFKHGSARLGGGDMRKLDGLADQAKFAPVGRVTVAGHASKPTQAGSNSVQGHILNLKQSMNRSFAVSKTLMQKGVPAEKIKTVSWGATKPSGNSEQDRRVDVIMGEQ